MESEKDLLKKIADLEAELKETKKFGLIWDKEHTPEKVVLDCQTKIPILKRIAINDVISDSLNNLVIEGDNYHSLVVLNYIYKDSIDFIYIDPPYNTGQTDFVYNDKFVNQDDGYIHSKWLSFMESRLKLARSLLSENGYIAISIDDNEQANLEILCDSIYGESNFVAKIIRKTSSSPRMDAKFISVANDYVLIYAKNINKLKMNGLKSDTYSPNNASLMKDSHFEERGYYLLNKLDRGSINYSQTGDYIIKAPDGSDIYAGGDKAKWDERQKGNHQRKDWCWRWGKEKVKWGLDNDFIVIKKIKNKWSVYFKQYEKVDNELNKISRTNPLSNLLTDTMYTNEIGKEEIIKVFGRAPFDYPKPVGLLKTLVSLHPNNNGIFLDFFAGSGTTGQAVLELNKEDGGNRRFILCTNNENNICSEITMPRIRTVITGKRNDGSKYSDGLAGNLRYFKTEFIANSKNRSQNKYNLVEKIDPLLCILEDTYNEVEKTDFSSHYSNEEHNKHLFIYNDFYNEIKFNQFKQKVEKEKGKKYVYIFNEDNIVEGDLFKGEDIVVKPIPAKIYEIYVEIVKDIKRG